MIRWTKVDSLMLLFRYRPELCRCNMCWKDERTLLIGWADSVKVYLYFFSFLCLCSYKRYIFIFSPFCACVLTKGISLFFLLSVRVFVTKGVPLCFLFSVLPFTGLSIRGITRYFYPPKMVFGTS